jgi:hypothetical protein
MFCFFFASEQMRCKKINGNFLQIARHSAGKRWLLVLGSKSMTWCDHERAHKPGNYGMLVGCVSGVKRQRCI